MSLLTWSDELMIDRCAVLMLMIMVIIWKVTLSCPRCPPCCPWCPPSAGETIFFIWHQCTEEKTTPPLPSVLPSSSWQSSSPTATVFPTKFNSVQKTGEASSKKGIANRPNVSIWPIRIVDSFLVWCRVAGLGRLSAGAKMAMKPFVKRVFTIFATNASFLRVISNFRI